MKSFCEILRELREDRDMTQADVANLLGTSQQYYGWTRPQNRAISLHGIGSERSISPVSPCRRMWKRLLRT